MSKPLIFGGKILQQWKCKVERLGVIAKKTNILFFAIALTIFAGMTSLWDSQTTSYAHAYTGDLAKESRSGVPLFKSDKELFDGGNETYAQPAKEEQAVVGKKSVDVTRKLKAMLLNENRERLVDGNAATGSQLVIAVLGEERQLAEQNQKFAEKLYEIVGDTPIKEMVPYISERDEKVAAFLVGIAKKESSFGLASPSKDGETCYNYWGYKSSGGRGTSLGYACFASAEEAVKIVGDRIEVLVNKQRNTPARMVDTWKCGTSCAGDPGAPSWVSTVALYYNKIVG
jgi:hypothetical protein